MRHNRHSGLVAVLVLAVGLTAGACGSGTSSHKAGTGTTATTPVPSATTAPASGSGVVTASDLKPIDDATSQLDNELGNADQGLNATEGDPTQ
jgi:hypothetical protein